MAYPLHTYTDLSTNLNKTVVLDKDNVFSQPVNFTNSLNQFAGTFTGTICSDTLEIDGGTFREMDLLSSSLVDSTLSATGISSITIADLFDIIYDLQSRVEELESK